MMAQGVVYLDKKAHSTGTFTEQMEEFLEKISAQEFEVVAAVPNAGVTETLGIWLFVRKRVAGE